MNLSDDRKAKIVSRLTRLEVILLFLLKSNDYEPIRGRTMMQKEAFLIARYIPDIWEMAEYIPHNHGAYSEVVEIASEELKSYGLIAEKNNLFCITDLGKELMPSIEKNIKEEEKSAIHDFKEFMNKMTLDEALVYSYFSYKEFTTDSAIISKVTKNRIRASVSMYQKGLINLEKAMFLSGLSGKNFLAEVRKYD